MQTTVMDVINQSLNLIGVLGTGTSITAEEYKACLYSMNNLLDRWNLTNLLIYAVTSNVFPFVPGQQIYTLGTGGNFNMPRPSKIERISIQYPSTPGPSQIELAIDFISLEEWQQVIVKDIPNVYPLMCYNDTSFPFMNLNFWPIPTGPANVVLYTWDQMPLLQNLTDTIELPTGYSDAIIYNLAVRLCQMFDRMPSPSLLLEAKNARNDINDINSNIPDLAYDPMFSNNSNASSIAVKSWGRVIP